MVVADRLGPRELLAELAPHVEVIDAAKIPYGRAMAQEAINDALIEHAKAGKSVVRLKGGDPFVFGRGMEEAEPRRRRDPGDGRTGHHLRGQRPRRRRHPRDPSRRRARVHRRQRPRAPDDPRSLVDWEARPGCAARSS